MKLNRSGQCPTTSWIIAPATTRLAAKTRLIALRPQTMRMRGPPPTGISEERVRAAGLDFLDPAEVDVAAWSAEPGTLVVPDAGEVLYRLRGD